MLALAPKPPAAPAVIDEDAGVLRVRVATLLAVENPLVNNVWGTGTFTSTQVAAAWARRPESGTGWCDQHAGAPRYEPAVRETCRACDLGRIGVFAYGTPPDETDRWPVTVDVGFGDFVPATMIVDGNHRVAAAAIRGGTWIDLSIAGDWDRALALFIDEVDRDAALYV